MLGFAGSPKLTPHITYFVFMKIPLLFFLWCFSAAVPGDAIELPHDVYIWQRLWTPDLRDSIERSKGFIDNWRVLAAEADSSGRLKNITADWALLTRIGKPVVLVFRIDAALSGFTSDALIQEITSTLIDWQQVNVPIRAVEIDYDCATARLGVYAEFLALLRRSLNAASDEPLQLSITALPAWLSSQSDLKRLLQNVDEAVLQVHAVQSPGKGLFDPAKARRWIREFNAVSDKPFRVALPTYGYRLNVDDTGKTLSVEGEMPLATGGASQQELSVSPIELATLLKDLSDAKLEHLIGIAWFRLPTAKDRRAFQLATWHALLHHQPLQAHVGLNVVLSPKHSGLYDLLLVNDGLLDTPLPAALLLEKANCTQVEALNGYRLTAASQTFNNAQVWRLEKATDAMLRSHHQRIVGWLRCSNPEVKRYVLQ